MSTTASPAPTHLALALALRLEFDRAKLPLGGEAFCRLTVSVPQAPAASLAARKGLALAFALDCSGSMADPAGAPDGSPMGHGLGAPFHHALHNPSNTKMERCKAAVWDAVELLGDDDMASLTAFASMAQTLFPLAAMTAANKAKFKTALDKCQASGGTALHDGWAEAGKQAASGIDRKLLCRVAMLTDGEASPGCGETNPEILAKHSAKLASLGVSTSCFGVGASFNEDLLCAMADAGEGNFRYIPDAMLAAAAAIDEVNGLGATAGRKAKLRIETIEGIESIEVLNPFDKDGDWLKLPTLLAGRPIEAVARVKLSASGIQAGARATITWENRDGIAQSAEIEVFADLIEPAAAAALPQDAEVAGAAAAMLAASAKTQMADMISAGNYAGATATLASARSMISSTAAYSGSADELASLDMLSAGLDSGDYSSTRKSAVFQSYSRSKNQTVAAKADPKKTQDNPKA